MEEPREIITEKELCSLQEVAAKLRRERLAAVACFLLEAHRPVFRIFSHGLLVLQPCLGPLLGAERLQFVTRLLSSSLHLETFLTMLAEDGRA